MNGYALVTGFDPVQAESFSQIVSAENLEPVIARGASDARGILKARGAPSLVLTEMSLTHADGFTLLGQLREISPASSTPALVISGFKAFRETALQMKDELGITEVLSSSARDDAVREAVRRSLAGAKPPEIPVVLEEPSRADEGIRLGHLEAMDLVDDGPADEDLQQLAENTAKEFAVPIALISLIFEKRQWFKAHYGLAGEILETRSTPRDISFCRHVVEADRIQPLVVPDAAANPYFACNPLVQQGIVRGYAGVPLVTPEGHVLGTLCIIDNKPLTIGPEQVDHLQELARRAAGELELKARSRRTSAGLARLEERLRQELEQHKRIDDSMAYLETVCSCVVEGVIITDADRNIILANQAFAEMFDIPLERAVKMTRDDIVLTVAGLARHPNECRRALSAPTQGPYVARCELDILRPIARRVRWIARPVKLPGGVGQVDLFVDLGSD